MLQRSTLQLLRFHFSIFLLPVFLFAISELREIDNFRALLCFLILHLLVYPASNGYNSYMDRDDSPIGGLKNPLQPTRELFWITVLMDALAVALAFLISVYTVLGISLYIIASRAYSYRGIRLKRYPISGFLTVFIFQGALVFWITYHSVDPSGSLTPPLLPTVTASLLIGALYPLTQVYQHEADRKDGVYTISMMLGKRGSFIFSGVMFLSATILLFFHFHVEALNHFYLFLFIMLPVVLFFLWWMMKVWRNDAKADFRNSLLMNVLSTLCTTIFFLTLTIIRH